MKGLTIGIPDLGRDWCTNEKRTFLKKLFIVQYDKLWSDEAGAGFIRVKAKAVMEEI